VFICRLFEALQVHNSATMDKLHRVKCLLLDIDERLVCFFNNTVKMLQAFEVVII